MSINLNVINNANIYIDGNSLVGKASQVKLPEIEIEQEELKALGLIGTINLPIGISALEAEITWNSFYSQVFKTAYSAFKNSQLMVRANVQTFDAAGRQNELPLVTILNATFSKNPLGEFKPKEKTEFVSTLKVHSIKQTLGSEEILFFDAFSNQYRVAGIDQLAQFRNNLGV